MMLRRILRMGMEMGSRRKRRRRRRTAVDRVSQHCSKRCWPSSSIHSSITTSESSGRRRMATPHALPCLHCPIISRRLLLLLLLMRGMMR